MTDAANIRLFRQALNALLRERVDDLQEACAEFVVTDHGLQVLRDSIALVVEALELNACGIDDVRLTPPKEPRS